MNEGAADNDAARSVSLGVQRRTRAFYRMDFPRRRAHKGCVRGKEQQCAGHFGTAVAEVGREECNCKHSEEQNFWCSAEQMFHNHWAI